MTIVPYQEPKRRPRRQLDRPRVVAAALQLLDEVGLDGLTMRRLAERLGVTAASLYRHVRDKDELLVLLGDEISGEVPLIDTHAPWRQALRDAAYAVRRALLAHRDAPRVLASTAPAGQQRLHHIDAVLGVLLAAGFEDRDAAWAAYHFNNLVTEAVADEVRVANTGRSRRELMAEARAQLRALPSKEFPSLTRMADYVASDDADAIFEFGVNLLLRAMESLPH